jgi:hypothetical protein
MLRNKWLSLLVVQDPENQHSGRTICQNMPELTEIH